MTAPSPHSQPSDSVRDAFLREYARDLEADCIRSLAEYQRRFPGHEQTVAEQWAWLEPGASSPAQPERAATARRIGRYRIHAELGRGAQATVYLAEHETLHRRVALKVLRVSPLDGDTTTEERFRREAEVTASIEHPGICSVYETGRSEGLTWIAMQYVRGRTLASHLADERRGGDATALGLPPWETRRSESAAAASSSSSGRFTSRGGELMRVVEFVEEAARALAAAHERGLVHRDIKPGNLMVADDGRPVILDFGLARAVSDDGAGLDLTRTTDVLGTPYYMAPEQIDADPRSVDARADVFALGVTLFECLTGRRPFDGVSIDALYRNILGAEPSSPRALNARIPRDLEVVLQTALEKDRARRYQTAIDLAEDLRRVRMSEPIRARPISAWGRLMRWTRRHPAIAGSAAVAAIAVIAGLAVSLVALRDARTSLDEKRAAMRGWYDDLSRATAIADTRDQDSPGSSRLRSMAVSLIEAEVPRVRSRFRGAMQSFNARYDVAGVLAGRTRDHARELRRLLSAPARLALADLLFEQTRNIVRTIRRPEDQGPMSRAAADLAEMILADLEALPPTDARVIRTRLLLLDASHQAGRFAEVERLARQWLAPRANEPHEPMHEALYEHWLGAALLGQGRTADAVALLERSVAVAREYRPASLEANTAIARLLELFDATDRRRDAERVRELLTRSLIASRDRHSSDYVYRMAHAPRVRPIWDLLLAFVLDCTPPHTDIAEIRPGAAAGRKSRDVDDRLIDGFLSRFTQLRRALAIADADPLTVLHAETIAAAASALEIVRGTCDAAVARLVRTAADLFAAGPPCHFSRAVVGLKQPARQAFASGDFAAAEDGFRKAVAICPPDVRPTPGERWLGISLAQRGKYDEAEQRLLYSLNASRERLAHVQLVTTLRDLVTLSRLRGDFARAKHWHGELLRIRGAAADHRDLGATCLRFGRLAEARAALDRALARNPGDARAQTLLAHVELCAGSVDAAIARTEAVLDRDAGASRVRARAILARGDVEDALEHFAAAETRGARWVDGDGFWTDYGRALAGSGDLPSARRKLRELTERRAGDPAAWHARARFLATTPELGADDRAEAVACARKAAELCQGGRAYVLATLADAQHRSGDAAAARQTANRLVELMAGGDAEWLTVEDATARQRGFGGR